MFKVYKNNKFVGSLISETENDALRMACTIYGFDVTVICVKDWANVRIIKDFHGVTCK